MVYAFDEYEIDTRRLELRRAAEACHVEPQVFDVLCYLVRHRDRLVSRRELLERVWGHAFVTETTLNSRLMSARRAIGDSGRAQRLIRTIHGRGYRFVGEVEERYPEPLPPGGAAAAAVPPASSGPRLPGREGPLHELQRLLDATLHGARRIAFVSGETGIGKTTLVESFLAGASAQGGIGTALGQCLDQRGAGEPFLPVLEALDRMCRGAGGGALAALLDRRAPTWLAQMPGLVEPEAVASLQERIRGATRERMLRELVDALEAWTAEQPLVLVIEDLHWSDPSTLQLIDCLARRREPARLLLVGTFRPAEVRTGGHPLQTLVQELRVRDRCTELVLSPLSGATVAEYLEQRFPGSALPAELHGLLHARTEGNPLFVRCLVDAWVARGALAPGEEGWELRGALSDLAEDVPETLRRLIQQQVERLVPEDQAVLEAGSVEGPAFSAAAAAAGLDRPAARVEERCDYLARHGRFLRSCGVEEWPDGTVSGRYAFVHHLHRDVVYERVSGGRRAGLHRGIGDRLETAYGARAGARTAQLALHFAEGRDGARAVKYRVRAAEQSLERSAHREAVDHLTRALGLLREHPDVPDAVQREVSVLRMLGQALVAVRGWNDPEAELAFRRARELCERTGDAPRLARVLYAEAYLHEMRGDYRRSQSLLEERFRLVLPGEEPGPRIESYEVLSCSLFHQGVFGDSLEKAQSGIRLFQPGHRGDLAAGHGEHAGVACHYWAGLALWFLGRPEQAAVRLDDAVRIAEEAGHLHMLAMARCHVAQLYQLRREAHRVLAPAEEALALAERQGYPYQYAIAQTMYGWARAAGGDVEAGLARIRDGLRAEQAIGAAMERPYFLGVLADALCAAGRVDEGLATVDEALGLVQEKGRAFFWEAELHRLRGALLMKRGGWDAEEVAAAFGRAREVARRQGAVSLELRAVLGLADPALGSAGDPDAGRALSDLCARFTEGFDTPDLREARARLGGAPRAAQALPSSSA